LKTTLVLEDQSRQQMIKMWKWCIKMWMWKCVLKEVHELVLNKVKIRPQYFPGTTEVRRVISENKGYLSLLTL
jgi:hypothetical protein